MKKSKFFGVLGLMLAGVLSLVGLTSCNNDVVKGDPSKVKYFETIEECYIEFYKDQEAYYQETNTYTSNVAVLTFIEEFENRDTYDLDLVNRLNRDYIEYDNYVKISDYLKTSLNYLTSKGLDVYIINTTKEDLEVYLDAYRKDMFAFKFGFYPSSVCKHRTLVSLLNSYLEGNSKYESLTDCLDYLINFDDLVKPEN